MKQHLTVKHAAHAVMLAFMLASLANVKDFFQHLHGDPIVAWGLGIALGIGLVVMAGLLSGMTWDWTDTRFMVVAGVAAALALLSGGIQAAAYAQHMDSKAAAIIVGLALPLVGELGVALAVSAYQQAIRRQRMADAQSQLADGVRGQIGEAIAAIDKSKIEAQVNRAATLVTKAIVDSTITDMLEDINRNRKTPAATSATEIDTDPPNEAPETAPSHQTAEFGPASLPAANEARVQKVAERHAAILQLFTTYGPMGAAELQNRLQDDLGIEASERTVRDDFKALEDAGHLTKIARGVWSIQQPVAVQLPTISEPVLNGHS